MPFLAAFTRCCTHHHGWWWLSSGWPKRSVILYDDDCFYLLFIYFCCVNIVYTWQPLIRSSVISRHRRLHGVIQYAPTPRNVFILSRSFFLCSVRLVVVIFFSLLFSLSKSIRRLHHCAYLICKSNANIDQLEKWETTKNTHSIYLMFALWNSSSPNDVLCFGCCSPTVVIKSAKWITGIKCDN